MQDTFIIGISGKKRTGKDTLANFLHNKYASEIDRFAAPIKSIVKETFRFDEDQINGHLKEEEDNYWGFTPRWAQQQIGTELFRQGIDPDVWVKSLILRVIESEYPIVIVPDIRFRNEVHAVREFGGMVIRLERDTGLSDDHASETALDEGMEWHYHYENDHSVDMLERSGDAFVKSALTSYTGASFEDFMWDKYPVNDDRVVIPRYTSRYDDNMRGISIYSDVDGVHANFTGGFVAYAKQLGIPFYQHMAQWRSWFGIKGDFKEIWDSCTHDHDFWMGLNPTAESFINFPLDGYVTARPVPSELTARWLKHHGYPDAPVYTVEPETSKFGILQSLGCDVFIDDKPSTVKELNEKGIRTYLVGTPHNWNYREDLPYIPNAAYLPEQLKRDGVI